MARGRIPFSGMRIPRRFRLITQPVDRGENGAGLNRVGIDCQSLLSFINGLSIVVVFKGHSRQQFLSFDELGIALESAVGQLRGAYIEVISKPKRKTQKRGRIVLLDFQGLLELL